MQIFVYAPGIPLCFGSNSEKKKTKKARILIRTNMTE